MSRAFCQVSIFVSVMRPPMAMPALLTRMSRESTSAAAACQSSSLVTLSVRYVQSPASDWTAGGMSS